MTPTPQLFGTDAELINECYGKITEILADNWKPIKDYSKTNGDKAPITIRVNVDWTGKTPVGTVDIGWGKKPSAKGAFKVEDKEQGKLV